MLTLISSNHLKTIIQLSGQAIRDFLKSADASRFKGEAHKAIISFQSNSKDFSDDKLVAYGADTDAERLALIIPSGLSGGVGSWHGSGWYIYWPASNPINSQLHRGPYPTENQCQTDLKELIIQEDTEDRASGLPPPSDPDRCAFFDVRPNFDQPF